MKLSNKDITRFWSKVSGRENPNGCWLWTGSLRQCGHGQMRVKRKTVKAHRIAWFTCRGPIPKDKEVMHNCPGGDNPACCNPKHLLLGTKQEHADDKKAKGQYAHGTNHYSQRHPEKKVHGEQHGSAKLTEKLVLVVIDRLTNKEPNTSIAKDLHISPSVISSIKHNRTWKHIARRTQWK
jgi:hypothetical protein